MASTLESDDGVKNESGISHRLYLLVSNSIEHVSECHEKEVVDYKEIHQQSNDVKGDAEFSNCDAHDVHDIQNSVRKWINNVQSNRKLLEMDENCR